MSEAEQLAGEFDWWVARGLNLEPRLADAAAELRRLSAELAALKAAIEAQSVPDGWQLVPKEPTPEMEAAAFDVLELPPTATESGTSMRNKVYAAMLASAPPAPQAKPIGWLYDWTHSSALGKPDEHFTSFTTDEEHARKNRNARPVFDAAQQAKLQPLSDERDARIAELERELEKEKQYVKEMTKDRDYWMTVAAERALLLDKNRKVSKPLSDEQMWKIWNAQGSDDMNQQEAIAFARAIEAAHGITKE